jgi:hypothetical protein
VGLEVQGAELVDADHDLGIARQRIGGGVHQPIQVQDPVLPDRIVRVPAVL